jgi:hypothetical protein
MNAKGGLANGRAFVARESVLTPPRQPVRATSLWATALPGALGLALALGVALALGLAAPSPGSAQSDGVLGRWRFIGGGAETSSITRAIDAALADFNPIMREIVASQLRDTNRAYPEFSVALEGDNIITRVNGRTVSTPANGTAREVTTPEGRTARVTQRIAGNRLVQTMVNPQGTRTHTITRGADGNLTVAVEIVSSHLPRPIRYALTYGPAA